MKEFFNELNRIGTLIPEDELKKSKNYVALGFPGEFETTGDLARKLEELVVYNLPDDTFAKFVGAVTSVTAADLQKLAARYIQPDKMAVVVVGDRKVIEGQIRQLNLGPGEFHHHRRIVPLNRLVPCGRSLPIRPGAMSEFRIEKRREAADVTLVTGATRFGRVFPRRLQPAARRAGARRRRPELSRRGSSRSSATGRLR